MLAASLLAGGPALAAAIDPIGLWGGGETRLVVSAHGATLEQGCASGRTDGPLRPGADGSFAVRGSFARHASGPQREDDRPGPALFEGRIEGDRMQLIISPATGPRLAETLERGRSVKLVRCL